MGMIDVIKDAGSGILGALNTGLEIAVPQYGDYRESQRVASDNQAILDPNVEGRFRTPQGQSWAHRKAQAKLQELNGLAQSALYADRDTGIQIGMKMDAIVGKKDYFSRLIEDAHNKTDSEFKVGDPSKDLAREKRIAVGYGMDPTMSRIKAGYGILDDVSDVTKKGAEAPAAVWQSVETEKQKQPFEIDTYRTKEGIATEEHKKRKSYDVGMEEGKEKRMDDFKNDPQRRKKKTIADAEAEADANAAQLARLDQINAERKAKGLPPYTEEQITGRKPAKVAGDKDIYGDALQRAIAHQDASLLEDIPKYLQEGGPVDEASGRKLDWTRDEMNQMVNNYNSIATKVGRPTINLKNYGKSLKATTWRNFDPDYNDQTE